MKLRDEVRLKKSGNRKAQAPSEDGTGFEYAGLGAVGAAAKLVSSESLSGSAEQRAFEPLAAALPPASAEAGPGTVNNAPQVAGIEGDSTIFTAGGGAVRLDVGGNAGVVDLDNNGFVVQRAGFAFPGVLDLAPVPDGSGRVFVVEKGGKISILNPATGAKSQFIDISATISTGGEGGLIGFATAPDYASSGAFYVFVTNSAGNIEVRRYLRSAGNANVGDPASGDVILQIAHPNHDNHNGGWLAFGPDGKLYLATGDGGGGGDPDQNAQNPNSLLGKILRVDVSQDGFPGDALRDYSIPADNPFAGGGGRGEIWALGLRNPFRNSFDPATGNLYIADVGQGEREEVNLMRPADKGTNFGWSILEGTRVYNGGSTAGLTAPVLEYGHGSGPLTGFSVTGGYVYRGAVSSLQGKYFFADFVTSNIWAVPTSQLSVGSTLPAAEFELFKTAFAPEVGRINQISSFGVDTAGNLYILDFGDGEVYRVTPSTETNFGAGSLVVSVTGGRVAAEDRIGIDTVASLTLSSGLNAGSEIRFAGYLIGTVTSGGGAELAIAFSSGATPARVELLMRALNYSNASSTPTPGARTIEFVLKDGAGTANGGKDSITFSTIVNVAPNNGGNDTFDFSQGGDDIARGGTGSDTLYFGRALTVVDDVDGGTGDDRLLLQGAYANFTLGARSLVGIETLALLSGKDASFGDTAGNLYSYDLTSINANVAAGQRLTVDASGLAAGESLTFDGSAETDGSFLFLGGLGNDLLTGGRGTDTAVFTGSRSQYQITPQSGFKILVSGPDGSDTLTGVERLQFSDGTFGVNTFAPPAVVTNTFGAGADAGGWSNANIYPRTFADVNGDGRADIVGFGHAGVYVSLSLASGGFATPYLAKNAFGAGVQAGGWSDNNIYPRTLGDVNGDGRADIVGFGHDGVYVSLAISSGGFGDSYLAFGQFGVSAQSGAWSDADTYPRMLADMNGDGRADIVGFGYSGVYVSLADGTGGFGTITRRSFEFGVGDGSGGWSSNSLYPRMVGDVNGDGRADIVGFGQYGVAVSLADSFSGLIYKGVVETAFGAGTEAGGWTSGDIYPRTVGDVNGDGMADLVGFGHDGVYVSLATGGGQFADPFLAAKVFGAGREAGGWTDANTYPRMLADVNGDDLADLVGFGHQGVHLALAADIVPIA